MFPIAELTEALCLAAALVYLRRGTGYWRLFIPFLALTLSVEIAAKVIAKTLNQSNHWLYNVYLLIDIFFTGFMLYQVFPKSRNTRRVFAVAGALMGSLYVWESMATRFGRFSNITDTVSSFAFVVAAAAFYFRMLKADMYIDLLRYPAFWFVTGLFLFHFGSMTIDLFSAELMNLFIFEGVSLRYVIIVFLMIVLYSCWAFAFKCRYQETILSSD